MIEIEGSNAISEAQKDRLSFRLTSLDIKLISLASHFIYMISSRETLSGQNLELIKQVLSPKNKYVPPETSPDKHKYYLRVEPREGTISPWSTKATDILHRCGVPNHTRVEYIQVYELVCKESISDQVLESVKPLFYDRMMQSISISGHYDKQNSIHNPKKLNYINILNRGRAALLEANDELGLALASDEVDYILNFYEKVGRNPTDVEMMMFSQANSEHCRHKIFNAEWYIDGEKQEQSLFQMIKNTYRSTPQHVLTAYKDNAAVMDGCEGMLFFPDPKTNRYRYSQENIDILMKVETHNHPTAISPFPGAATGSGGEIRDEGATGRGGKPKAGFAGFCVSNLRLPGLSRPWEKPESRPARIASPLEIMKEGPIGSASFNNEFGRPGILGFFRTFEQTVAHEDRAETRGFHKPIMIAGGLGNIRREHVEKQEFSHGAAIVVLGGPSMLIGLGGGSASSMASGAGEVELDFASVQRGNPEMERRCQEVIDRCWAMGSDNPISFIHDVGAGGLSNAVPEIINDGGRGGRFDIRRVPSDDHSMSPLEIWCNESQERYVIAVEQESLPCFESICKRERCPYSVLGYATDDKRIVVDDEYFGDVPIDLPLEFLLGKPPQMIRREERLKRSLKPINIGSISIEDAAFRLLRLPTIAEKTFLITIADRSVTGLVTQDQMVGPWQVPVADCAVTASGHKGFSGEAMALGERPPVALISPKASARLAVGEAITNIAGSFVHDIERVKLSANWQAAPNYEGDGADLYDAVRAIAIDLCPKLGLTIPVGKDSMSMRTTWESGGAVEEVISPISLVITAFAKVEDVRKTITPQLMTDVGETDLFLIDLGHGKNRLGGSCLAQVYNQLGDVSPDVEDADELRRFFDLIQDLNQKDLLLAYHDRSDGGLFCTLLEMAFAGRVGIHCDIESLGKDHLGTLFSEELGAVLQVESSRRDDFMDTLVRFRLDHLAFKIGQPSQDFRIRFDSGKTKLFSQDYVALRAAWAETTRSMQTLRDNPKCADEEHQAKLDLEDPGLNSILTFETRKLGSFGPRPDAQPIVCILREQGVNGHFEMAAAFHKAGFDVQDVHMSDIFSGRVDLSMFSGLVACGGFSYGDVLGAGAGWAKSILHNERVKKQFQDFFERDDTFSLGVCNGCQMFSLLSEIIPGAQSWPSFTQNDSDQFEARVCTVEIDSSPSIFLQGMEGSRIPIAVAHGEGKAVFSPGEKKSIGKDNLVSLRFVDNHGKTTERYPFNPNGSVEGVTGVTTLDGRVTIMMPHPERVIRKIQNSWAPKSWDEDGPWLRMFQNAYDWVLKQS